MFLSFLLFADASSVFAYALDGVPAIYFKCISGDTGKGRAVRLPPEKVRTSPTSSAGFSNRLGVERDIADSGNRLKYGFKYPLSRLLEPILEKGAFAELHRQRIVRVERVILRFFRAEVCGAYSRIPCLKSEKPLEKRCVSGTLKTGFTPNVRSASLPARVIAKAARHTSPSDR